MIRPAFEPYLSGAASSDGSEWGAAAVAAASGGGGGGGGGEDARAPRVSASIAEGAKRVAEARERTRASLARH
jgi:hypothetical protein